MEDETDAEADEALRRLIESRADSPTFPMSEVLAETIEREE